LGAACSAALWQLAAHGQHVLGIDQYTPPHALGSSHGRSRIIREAYFEDPQYVPLVQRAYTGWRELEALSGASLLRETGGLMIGPPSGALVSGARASAIAHALPHELLHAEPLRARTPAFTLPADSVAVFEPRAGVLDPEQCIRSMLHTAASLGATIAAPEHMLSWHATHHGVTVITASGTLTAKHLVLALGPWASAQLHGMPLPLAVERNVLFWFRAAAHAELFSPEQFPVFLFDAEPECVWYGFPDTGSGIKVALHGTGRFTTANDIDRHVHDDEVANMRSLLDRYLPSANGELIEAVTCMYTKTPDEHFVLDRHPEHGNVVVASACSGHGFKFAPVLGEMVARLITDPAQRAHPLFSAARFAAS
jgi:sarcosine oxidase